MSDDEMDIRRSPVPLCRNRHGIDVCSLYFNHYGPHRSKHLKVSWPNDDEHGDLEHG